VRLTIEGISKVYNGKVKALKQFSLELGPGVLGLVGPNGAGKSTLMRILATITQATEGRVTWNGVNAARSPDVVRAELGYLPQDFGVYTNLNAVEFLQHLAAVRGLSGRLARCRIDELLEVVNLVEARKRPLGGFSGGMKQRIGIAQALLNDPKLLIVDEPTAGLDPEERVRFPNMLSELSGQRVVILSTHIVSDVQATATEIAVISGGRLVIHTSPEALLKSVEGKVWEWVIPSSALAAVKQSFFLSATTRRGDGVHVRVVDAESPHPDAVPMPPTLENARGVGTVNGADARKSMIHLSPLSPAALRFRAAAVLLAELQLMLKRQRWWWYVVAAGLLIASLANPAQDARRELLPWVWLWPILLWSAMGTREARHETDELVFSAAHPLRRQFPAAWFAGVIVAVLMGSGVALRLLLARD
jgi:ABC-2 type transport system ATP-binding protein